MSTLTEFCPAPATLKSYPRRYFTFGKNRPRHPLPTASNHYFCLTESLFSATLCLMVVTVLSFILLIGQTSPAPGFLTVRSDPPGYNIFVEGDTAGLTPLERYQLDPGRYWVTIVSNDSLEALYRQLRSGTVGARLHALWTLARIDGATSQVELLPGLETRVLIDRQTMEKNACRAKWLVFGGIGGVFTLGLVCGVIIGVVAH